MKIFISFFIVLVSIISASSQFELPEKFIAESLPLESLESPVGIEFTYKGQAFIWEKNGLVWTFQDDKLSSEPLLDIREEINTNSDHGLVGFALDPSFQSNGYYYLLYVVDRHHLLYAGTPEYDPNTSITSQATIGRLTRYTADINTNFTKTVEESRKIIIGESFEDGLPILMTSHGVGSLVFATDGSLMVTFGDGGSFKESDIGNADDTYHEQSIEDGTLKEEHNVGSFRAMMKTSANGKLLRIDPSTGKGISSNPYFEPDNPGSFRSMVWALGFRNPYKFLKIPNTGSHFQEDGDPGSFLLGDVGSSLWEELNYISQAGGWYGWPFFEGYNSNWGFKNKEVINKETPNPALECDYFTFRDLRRNKKLFEDYNLTNTCDTMLDLDLDQLFIHEPPLLAYSNAEWNPPAKTSVMTWYENSGNAGGISISEPESGVEGSIIDGGSIIPGGFNDYGVLPEEYDGRLFLGDFTGRIYTMVFNDDFEILKVEPFANSDFGITDVKFNPLDGNLYVVHIVDKKIYRISYGGTLPPTIIATQDYAYGVSPLAVNIDASQSISNSETPLSWNWMLDGELISEEKIFNYQFTANGPKGFEVELIVEDEEGKQSKELFQVSVNNTPPKVDITSMEDGDTYALEEVNTFELIADVTDLEFADDDLSYEWHVDLYHNEHFHQGPLDNRHLTYAFVDPIGCGLENYWYKIILTVSDPAGLSTADTVNIYPYCGERFANVVDLAAEPFSNNVELNWSMALTDNVSYFEIERSDDFLYKTIGRVEGGTSLMYNFIDNQPFIGKNLYRLKAYNEDGNYVFSNTVEIEFTLINDFIIYPNPGNSILNIESNIDPMHGTSISVIDFSGRLIYRSTFDSGNVLIRERIDVGGWENGVYYILMSNNNLHFQAKFLKL